MLTSSKCHNCNQNCYLYNFITKKHFLEKKMIWKLIEINWRGSTCIYFLSYFISLFLAFMHFFAKNFIHLYIFLLIRYDWLDWNGLFFKIFLDPRNVIRNICIDSRISKTTFGSTKRNKSFEIHKTFSSLPHH